MNWKFKKYSHLILLILTNQLFLQSILPFVDDSTLGSAAKTEPEFCFNLYVEVILRLDFICLVLNDDNWTFLILLQTSLASPQQSEIYRSEGTVSFRGFLVDLKIGMSCFLVFFLMKAPSS
jgi:hypothetical protein